MATVSTIDFTKAVVLSQDSNLKLKAIDLPEIISDWTGGVQGKRVLDFGSGFGYTAWGLAMLGAAYVAGVDINKEYLAGREVIRRSTGLDWPPSLSCLRPTSI
jgi:predicted RNA methylase